MAEALNGLVREAMGKNLCRGFQVGVNKVDINILQYADDTIFIGEASMMNVKAIKAILRTFEQCSFGAIGMSEQWKGEAAKYLNCSLLTIPFIYLGIPHWSKSKKVSDMGSCTQQV